MTKDTGKSIVIIGTLDTKGDQLKYFRDLIKGRGHQVIIMDVGVMGDVPFTPEIDREEVAKASGAANLQEIADYLNENRAMNQMTEGAAKLVNELYSKGEINGVVSVGGSMGTALGLDVMGALPLGIPKLIITTIAYLPAITPERVASDIMMLPWSAGLWGLNSISERVLEIAAGVISGAADAYDQHRTTDKKIVALTSLGQTVCRYVDALKPAIEARGYEVAVYHCTGMSGRMLERAIESGQIAVVLDLSVGVEMVNEVANGVCTAGKHRLEAAGRVGIPQIVSPGPIEAFHWGADKPMPSKLKERPYRIHNGLLKVIVSSIEERALAGKLIAEKLNMAKGPTALVIPTEGVFHAHQPTGDLDPNDAAFFECLMSPQEGLKAFREAVESNINKKVNVVNLEGVGLNEQEYVDTVLSLFDEMVS